MLWSTHPDAGIQLVQQRFRDLSADAARVHRASEARAGRQRARGARHAIRVGAMQRVTGVALVRLGSRLLHECYPFPAPSRG
jgi:hypothetical protein